jgi:hypothetical protein
MNSAAMCQLQLFSLFFEGSSVQSCSELQCGMTTGYHLASLGITWPCIGFVISLFLFARCPSRASPKSSMGYAEEAVQARAHDQTWPPVASLTGYRWLSMATGHPPLTTGKPHSKLVPPISEQNQLTTPVHAKS